MYSVLSCPLRLSQRVNLAASYQILYPNLYGIAVVYNGRKNAIFNGPVSSEIIASLTE